MEELNVNKLKQIRKVESNKLKEEKVKKEHHTLVISTSDAAKQLIMKGGFAECLYKRYLTGINS